MPKNLKKYITQKHWLLNINGSCASGKSYLIKYILRCFKAKYAYICVISTTAKYNSDYDFLKSLNIPFNIKLPSEFESKVDQIKNIQNSAPKKKNICIIVDDCLGLLKDQKYFTNLLSIHRHHSLDIIISTQFVNASSTLMREISNYNIIFSQKTQKSLKLCYENYFQHFETYKEFKAYFKNALPKYHFFLISQSENLCEILKAP